MGCAGSKKRRCSFCDAPYSPTPRALHFPLAHPPPQRGDYNHYGSLSSSTLGWLSMRSSYRIDRSVENDHNDNEDPHLDFIDAKRRSDVIEDEKTPPYTPSRTPPRDPEIIDAWEIMKGLEDSSPMIFSSFRKSFQRSKSITQNNPAPDQITSGTKPLLGATQHEKIVLYFTSLRGVRKTFEDCCNVRGILRGHRVKIDERDVSLDSGFRDELVELLGDTYQVRRRLPLVFIGTKYVGGAEEVKKLHEEGELEKLLRRCEKVESYKLFNDYCSACGGVRFVPCETCSGSCKVFYEKDESVSDDGGGEFGFRRCPDCNENGLIRCPSCFY